jgi:NAD(P)-dependent dehydrogenase (short-subunit alcohol dehydrogenase family)
VSRVVVVTGASAGVGRATAIRFAREGYDVGLIARGRAGLEGARRDVEAQGRRALVLPLDVADADAVREAAERVERELGPIDVWVNNAMTAVLGRVWDSTAEDFRRVTEVTYLGSVHGYLAALSVMRPRDRGTIVQVGSALAWRGIPLQATYCAAKHAIQGFYESLRTELSAEGSNIKLSMVHLPGLNTTQFGWVKLRGLTKHPQPVAPIFQPEVAAKAIVSAAKRPRRQLWVAFPTYYTIMGNWFAPALEDLYLTKTAVGGQQTDQPAAPDREDYLHAPVDDDTDRGPHGIFDDQAKDRSIALELTLRRRPIAAAAALALGAAVAAGVRS